MLGVAAGLGVWASADAHVRICAYFVQQHNICVSPLTQRSAAIQAFILYSGQPTAHFAQRFANRSLYTAVCPPLVLHSGRPTANYFTAVSLPLLANSG